MADLAEWKRRASNGTSGDMVWGILADWEAATEDAGALKSSHLKQEIPPIAQTNIGTYPGIEPLSNATRNY